MWSGAERFEQVWWNTTQETILSSLTEICPEVMEEMLFEAFSIFGSGSYFVNRTSKGPILSTLVEICPVVTEEMSSETNWDDRRWTQSDHNS